MNNSPAAKRARHNSWYSLEPPRANKNQIITKIIDVGFEKIMEYITTFMAVINNYEYDEVAKLLLNKARTEIYEAEWYQYCMEQNGESGDVLNMAEIRLESALDNVAMIESNNAKNSKMQLNVKYLLAKNKLDNVDDINKPSVKRIISKLHADFIYKLRELKRMTEKARVSGYKVSILYMKHIIRMVNICFKFYNTDRKMMFERDTNNKHLRELFLVKIADSRTLYEKRPTVYVDEMFINQNLSENSSQIAPTTEENGIAVYKRLIVCLAVSNKTGLVFRQMCLPEGGTGDYYRNQITQTDFKLWFIKLLNTLTEPSLILMDSSAYRSEIHKEHVNLHTNREDLLAWLLQREIPCWPDESLKQLRAKIEKAHLRTPEQYELDSIAASMQHQVIRIPPLHPHYSPPQILWHRVKHIVYQNNCTGDMNTLPVLVDQAIHDISFEEWSECMEDLDNTYARKLEIYKEYLKNVSQN